MMGERGGRKHLDIATNSKPLQNHIYIYIYIYILDVKMELKLHLYSITPMFAPRPSMLKPSIFEVRFSDAKALGL